MSEWISVKNQMPEKTGYYLCTYISDNHRFYYDRWYNEGNDTFNTVDNITHWMPLPSIDSIKNE